MAVRSLKLAGIYLLIGMTMGIAMGAMDRFALAPAHAHINLLGWVTLALAGMVFAVWPATATTRLARAFFWLYNVSLPVTLLALTLVLSGDSRWLPLMAAAQLGVYAAAVLFVVNIYATLRGAVRRPALFESAASVRRHRGQDSTSQPAAGDSVA